MADASVDVAAVAKAAEVEVEAQSSALMPVAWHASGTRLVQSPDLGPRRSSSDSEDDKVWDATASTSAEEDERAGEPRPGLLA